jgi:hypothetical protein
VWTGLRDLSPIAFDERQLLKVAPIVRLQVRGSF